MTFFLDKVVEMKFYNKVRLYNMASNKKVKVRKFFTYYITLGKIRENKIKL